MGPIDKVLKCESKQMPRLHLKRANHSSIVARDHLFLFFGNTYKAMNMQCSEFEYIHLSGENPTFTPLKLDECETSLHFFKSPMIFPETLKQGVNTPLDLSRFFFFGGDDSVPLDKSNHKLIVYELLIHWES